MLNVRNLVVDSFKMLGDIGDSESLDGTRASVGVQLLNEIISQLNLENYFSFNRQNITLQPTQSKSVYSIGLASIDPNVDINADRPSNILRAYGKDSGSNTTQYELEQVSPEDLPLFEIDAVSLPQYFSYLSSYPIGNIKLNCSLASSYEITFVYSVPLPIMEINDVLSIPYEYEPALKHCLSYLLAIRYGKPSEVIAGASALKQESLEKIRANTIRKTPFVAHLLNGQGQADNILNAGAGY